MADEANPASNSEQPEELILGRFKTADDLASAYKELEGEFTRKSQTLSEKERMLTELQTTPPYRQEPGEDEDDDDQLFFKEPAKAIEKVVRKIVDPLFTSTYNHQKEAFKSDPDFLKYENEIDNIITQFPKLKTQPNIVGQIFKMVKGLYFDPVEFESKVREKLKTEHHEKVAGGLEGSTPSEGLSGTTPTNLTDDEKRVAIRFNPGITKEEAYKKYAEKRVKCGGER